MGWQRGEGSFWFLPAYGSKLWDISGRPPRAALLSSHSVTPDGAACACGRDVHAVLCVGPARGGPTLGAEAVCFGYARDGRVGGEVQRKVWEVGGSW